MIPRLPLLDLAEVERYSRQVSVFRNHRIQVNASFVFGFDHDDAATFERTVAWIERHRLACATFHILTPYPGTPLFRRLEREGRILTRDWSRYDTGHAVFVPSLMSADELEEGYAWCYRELFSLGSIWRRRPRDVASLPIHLGGSLLYKKMNWLWPRLTQARATHAVWRPLITLACRRHRARVARAVAVAKLDTGLVTS